MNNNTFRIYTIDEIRELCKRIKPLYSYNSIEVGRFGITVSYMTLSESYSVTFDYLEISTWLSHSDNLTDGKLICSMLSSQFLKRTNRPLSIEFCEFFEDLPKKSQDIL